MKQMKLMKHQKEAVNKILEHYNNSNNMVIYTSGVGTGKTSVFCGVAKEIDGRILYIVPKKAIISNVLNNKMFKQDKLKNRVDFTTFNYFSDMFKGNKLDDYSLIIIDEAHHIGSDKYGNILMKCLNERNINTLALTATPERMDNLNVKTLFDVVVNGLSNFEAIEQGLMPRIEYLVCSPNEKVPMDNVRINWDNSYKLLKEAVQENPKNKWICFFSKISDLKAMKLYIKSIFPNYEVLEIHSNSGDIQEILNKANKSDKCVMLNCDMLLEGLHFDNVDGIILFRNVYSLPVFEQIIGRVSAIFKTEEPLVIDCTDTWLRMDRYIEYEGVTKDISEKDNYHRNSTRRKSSSRISDELSKTFVLNTPCYVSLKNKKYYDYMNFLKKQYNRRYISVVYKGVEYPSKTDCCKAYGISLSRVTNIEREKNVDFTTALDITLERIDNTEIVNYRGEKFKNWSDVCKKYNLKLTTISAYKTRHNLTYKESIDHHIDKCLIRTIRWTKEERDILFKYYPKEGSAVANRLDRKTSEQCRSFAKRHKIKVSELKRTKCVKWTDEEIKILCKYYPTEGRDVVKRFENRNLEQIRCKAKRMKIRYIGLSERG